MLFLLSRSLRTFLNYNELIMTFGGTEDPAEKIRTLARNSVRDELLQPNCTAVS